MKIAMMVRGYITAPQPSDIIYAPINLAVDIAEGLAKRGHQVDFYGPEGTEVKSGVKTLNLKPLATDYKTFHRLIAKADLLSHYVLNLWDGFLVTEMFKKADKGEYDLLYFIHPEVALAYSPMFPGVPVVYTIHDPINKWYDQLFKMYATPSQHLITLSNNQRKPDKKLPYLATVYNGLDLKKFPFSAKKGDYLLFVGRMVSEKGIKEAVEVARATGEKLIMIGPIYSNKRAYFDKHVRPFLNDKIKYLGYIEPDKLAPYYQNAKALLTPIKWEEPFGMTFLEAMACGTPVISMRRGSAPEVIVDGKTGYLVNNLEEMIAAVKKIDKISRRACREHVVKNFSIDKMIDGYEAAFLKALEQA